MLRRRKEMLEDMIVFHKTYEFIKWLHALLNNFPKSEKYTLAQKIENASLSVLEGVIKSNHDFDKAASIEATIVELDKLRVFFRLAKDLRFISFAQYEEGAKLIDEIGRLLGGWKKKSSFRPQPARESGARLTVSGSQQATLEKPAAAAAVAVEPADRKEAVITAL